jgi:hypothetical protein
MAATAPIAPKPAPKAQAPRPVGQPALNPERVPPLVGKFAKMLGKDFNSLTIKYTAEGVNVTVQDGDGKDCSLAKFFELKKKAHEASDEEKERSFRNKYELRLNKEFPKEEFAKLTTKGDAKIQEFLETLGFRDRRALLMTQKQFAAANPNGNAQA